MDYNYCNADEQQDKKSGSEESEMSDDTKSFNEEAFERNLHRHDTSEAADTIQIGLNFKQAAQLLPQVFTQFGTIKRNPDSLAGRGQKSAIERAMVAARLQNRLEDDYLALVELDLPAGKIILNPELVEFMVSNDLIVDMATKGWNFRAK